MNKTSAQTYEVWFNRNIWLGYNVYLEVKYDKNILNIVEIIWVCVF